MDSEPPPAEDSSEKKKILVSPEQKFQGRMRKKRKEELAAPVGGDVPSAAVMSSESKHSPPVAQSGGWGGQTVLGWARAVVPAVSSGVSLVTSGTRMVARGGARLLDSARTIFTTAVTPVTHVQVEGRWAGGNPQPAGCTEATPGTPRTAIIVADLRTMRGAFGSLLRLRLTYNYNVTYRTNDGEEEGGRYISNVEFALSEDSQIAVGGTVTVSVSGRAGTLLVPVPAAPQGPVEPDKKIGVVDLMITITARRVGQTLLIRYVRLYGDKPGLLTSADPEALHA